MVPNYIPNTSLFDRILVTAVNAKAMDLSVYNLNL